MGLWSEDGRWCDDKESILATVVTYFQNIYTTTSPSCIEEIIKAIPIRVTREMNEELTCPFIGEEVIKALHYIHPTKAPGLDGMSAVFFHKYWSIVGTYITSMVLNVLNHNLPTATINKTNIALIPKNSHPTKMTEFRPISLCNVAYKLISTTLANRLKAILPIVITKNQSAFTFDRLIIDNVLVAFELMHYLNHKSDEKDNFMSIKLNMSKAFNRVEWGFVKGVMERLGFDGKWISLIMQCISSVFYSIIINGEAYGSIIPTRGLRQGDPFSPGLFLFCAEGLSALIHQAARTQALHGISICRGCPIITHLFFADDNLLFCKASAQQCLELVQILRRPTNRK